MKRQILSCAFLAIAFLLMSQAAFAQTNKYNYLEAECPDSSAGAYSITRTDHGGFSGPGHLQSTANTTVGSFNGTSADVATYHFRLFEPQLYKVYFRVNTNGSAADDSWFFNFDGYEWVTVNNIPGSGWIWVESPAYMSGDGPKTLQIANRENGLNIDKIAILKSSEPAPTGLGAAAYNCPVPVHFEAECRTEASAGYGIRHIKKAGFSGRGYLESRDNTYNVGSGQDTVAYTFQTGSSKYSLYFRVHTNNSYDDDSLYYRVDGGSWQTLNGVAGQGWRWAAGEIDDSLTKGEHKVEIMNREDGLSLDKVSLIPSGYPAPTGVGAPGVNCYGDSDDWRATDVYRYTYGHTDYFFEEGAYLLDTHFAWHSNKVNGSGGTTIPGSGTAFLGFHRAVVNRFEQYALENGGIRWESIAVDAYLPYLMYDSYSALTAAGVDKDGVSFVDQYSARHSSDLTTVGHPAFLTADGIFDPNADENTPTFDFVTYYSLGEIETLEILGSLIGNYYHMVVHQQINGTMSTFYSPADPAFYLWHGRLDQIVDDWLNTTAGRAWQAANPDHAFLEPGFTQLTGWNTLDWANL